MSHPFGSKRRTVSSCWNAAAARRQGEPSRRPPGSKARSRRHRDSAETRESLISLVSTQARIKTGQPAGVHRVTKAPAGKARGSAGSILVLKRGDDRYEGTSGHRKGTSEGR